MEPQKILCSLINHWQMNNAEFITFKITNKYLLKLSVRKQKNGKKTDTEFQTGKPDIRLLAELDKAADT